MESVGPAVGEHQPLRVWMPHRLDAEHVPDFPLGPVGARYDVGDGVDFGVVRRYLGDDAAQDLVLVEGKVMEDQEVAGVRTVVGTDADYVTGVEIAEYVPADGL